MSLNDSTLEGDFYNTRLKHNEQKDEKARKDDFDIIANSIANNMFNQPNLFRRIYESIKEIKKRLCNSCIHD